MRTKGTQGYGAEADVLAVRYESLTSDEVLGDVLHLIPGKPGRVLDVGAGTGRDAAALARRGHAVTAVEPTPELRAHGRRLHEGAGITWLDDTLPDLSAVKGTFDLVLLVAVWMHLDEAERPRAMRRLAGLLAPEGVMLLTLRHGPTPPGRHMFDVAADETVAQAAEAGLRAVHLSTWRDLLGRPGVRWTTLAFTPSGDVS
ncbi:class I SAM-dependent methyltransferase [Actinomadura logoneensis]|uniref:Class I SAM-dependent methyltransferase n=1 Tax=Actinomadura logoneensis TaxID=2293572 RepID=A0A372JJ80_9ACTN|nr:class I SAM-dependent methyltransferase [Actinomadura logoneensis]RFU40010.1 class I SAM-dependent methyltransferase [Actinomadura logoneensis]